MGASAVAGGGSSCMISPAAAARMHENATRDQASKWQQVQMGYLGYLKSRDAWQAILGGIIGAYAMIKQYMLFEKQIDIAEGVLDLQRKYYRLAEHHYYNVAIPTFNRMRDLYDRYVSQFQSYESRFMADAFRLKEYQPQYDAMEARVFGKVQQQFDRALRQKVRARGRYNAGRPCYDMQRFATLAAIARVDAINHAYRQEEHRKRQEDRWYWERRVAGMNYQHQLASRGISGILRGAGVATDGLRVIGDAGRNLIQAQEPLAAAYANMGNFWGSIANGAFQFAGYALGRSPMIGWMPPPYGGGSFGMHGPGMTNFAVTGNAGQAIGQAETNTTNTMSQLNFPGFGGWGLVANAGNIPQIPGEPRMQ